MSGIRKDKGSALWIHHAIEKSDELAGRDVIAQCRIERGTDVCGTPAIDRKCPPTRLHVRHPEFRAHSLPRDIRNAERHPPVSQLKHIKVIATDCGGRLPCASDLESRQLRCFARKKENLDFASVIQ